MAEKSQFSTRLIIALAVGFCTIPSVAEGVAIVWGQAHGMTGKALRDGLDFWAGGFLLTHGQAPMLFDHMAYQSFLQGLYGKLPYHLWSYPPTYGLVAAMFAGLPPWVDVLTWDAAGLAALALMLRAAGKGWGFVACVLLAPATLENALEHQNAALMTALIGGALLLEGTRPRVAGVLAGLATIKPQLGVVLPLHLLRRAPVAFAYAALAAVGLAALSLAVFGPSVWAGFLHFTSPMMTNVLLTGQPREFAGGLISAFALARPFCPVSGALVFQVLVTLACMAAGVFTRSVPALLILSALASPYLHDYDLLGAALAVALIVEARQTTGFAPGEPVLLFLVWFGPGLLPWMPQYAHLAPVLLALLLASAWRRGGVAPSCDSSPVPPGSPVSSAGP
jgi:hypothetical protein